jgi:hypothetical protein
VLVAPGTYPDTTHVLVAGELRPVNVSIKKNIVLLGETTPADVQIDATGSDVGIYVSGVDEACVIARVGVVSDDGGYGCIIPAPGASRLLSVFHPTGVYCKDANPSIESNEFNDVQVAIELNGSHASITDNEFRLVVYGVRANESSGGEFVGNRLINYGLGVETECALDIIGNTFSVSSPGWISCTGVYDRGSSRIESNVFESLNNEGVLKASASTIVSNRFQASWTGVYVAGSGGTVSGNVFVNMTHGVEAFYSGSVVFENNTFDDCHAVFLFWYPPTSGQNIRRNIISNSLYAVDCFAGAPILFECNNVYNTEISPGQTCLDVMIVQHNFSADPEFCGVPGSGLYTLQSDSPCAPGNHPDGIDCGLIGALPVDCGEVDVKTKSWGQIKALMRKDRQ